MKSFITVLKFEIMHYLKNRVFLVTTVLLMLLIAGGLSVPTIVDAMDQDKTAEEQMADEGDLKTYGLYDPNQVIEDVDYLAQYFYLGEIDVLTDYDQLKKDVLSGDLAGAYVIHSSSNYQYVVLNNEMMDSGLNVFSYAFTKVYQKQGFEARGIDFTTVEPLIEPSLTYDVEVLGKDSAANYSYTYILVFGLYMIIILYGQLIATAVASEKSNRTMELLVTSTKSTNLIFGKVLGGAFVSALQVCMVIAMGKLFYALNAEAWDGFLDFIFDIPGNVLLNFSIFGILGYLFYAFIYGALGALVSKTEDVNTSVMPLTLVFVAVFLIAVLGMQNTEGALLKIASYVPFSSFMAMFVRISMGVVTWYEVMISLTILIITTMLVGWIGAKIYRMGTLMYGNPVKFKDIPKILKSQ